MIRRLRHTLALCSLVALSGCSERYTIEEVWSPDRRHKAVVYSAAYGATTSLNTAVSITDIPAGDLPRHANVFAAIHGTQESPEGPYFGPKITVRWITGDHLEIAYDPRAQVKVKNGTVDGVRISYRVAPQVGLSPRR